MGSREFPFFFTFCLRFHLFIKKKRNMNHPSRTKVKYLYNENWLCAIHTLSNFFNIIMKMYFLAINPEKIFYSGLTKEHVIRSIYKYNTKTVRNDENTRSFSNIKLIATSVKLKKIYQLYIFSIYNTKLIATVKFKKIYQLYIFSIYEDPQVLSNKTRAPP